MLLTEASQLLISSAFDRRQEEKADLFGLELLEKSDIDPRNMGTVFRHLQEANESYNPRMEIIMSHPDMDSRIRMAYDYQPGKNFHTREIPVDWKAVQQQVIHQKSQ
jgi:predicted Zn-dependent protease